MTPTDFICFLRFFLNLPQILRQPDMVKHEDSGDWRACCMACPGSLLDPHGNHASGNCPSASAAVHQRHSFFQGVLVKASQDAFLAARREPPTHEVLGGRFTAEEARHLFPKRATKHGKEIIAEITRMSLTKPEPEAKEEQKAWKRKYKALMDQICQSADDKVGRRVDIQVTNTEEEAGQERLVDTSVTHTTNKTNYRKSHQDAERRLRHRLGLLDKKDTPPPNTPALLQRTQDKIDTYGALVALLKKQFDDRLRSTNPVFVPAIATTHGELGPDLIRFMEWITKAHKLTLMNAPPRADGRKPEQLAALFRKHLREKVILAIVRGTARVLREAGLSKSACRKHA
jgi:hypothetical protein